MQLKRFIITLFAISGLLAIAAGPHYHFMRPCIQCNIPVRDYQYGGYSQPFIALSAPAVFIRSNTSTAPVLAGSTLPGESVPPAAVAFEPTNGKLFQFVDAPEMPINHCRVKLVAVQLYSNGDWVLSLRADQNPSFISPLQSNPNLATGELPAQWTEHLKRNLFRIKIRCYSNYDSALEGPARPVVAELAPHEFWVQKGQPLYLRYSGINDRDVLRAWRSIDRVEVEFSYRLAQYELVK